MSYVPGGKIVARPAYGSGLGSVWDDIGGFLKGTASAYGDARAAQGANAALQAQAAAAQVPVASSGIDMKTIAVVGGIGLVGILLFKKLSKK